MRTLLYIGSLAMIAAGIFCIANASAAFLSVAFVIGIIFIAVGIVEVVTGKRSDFDVVGKDVSLAIDGIIMIIFGLVIISGQITDDITAQMLFALWMVIEGAIAAGSDITALTKVESNNNADIVLSVAMLILGVYTFFNTRLLDLNAIVLIGATLMLLGLRRFRISFGIEYNRPGFLTGTEERLEEAQAEEKKALAKAKEGIREQKIAQRRIEKIKTEIEQENAALNDAASRKNEEKNNSN